MGGVLSATTAVKLPKIVNKIFLFNPYMIMTITLVRVYQEQIYLPNLLFNISLPVAMKFFSS